MAAASSHTNDGKGSAALILHSLPLALLAAILSTNFAGADDWPMARYDAQRSAATPATLPSSLHLRWSRKLVPQKAAWPDQPRVRGDGVYQPIVIGDRIVLTSSSDNSVVAFGTADGSCAWEFVTGGPIRVPPAGADGRVFVGSDDGWLYCLDASTGRLLWKIKGAPRTRLILGNGRLIDTWPVRGGPVVADGKVYFAAGLWPFMGVFVHCVEANTGRIVWTNSGDGSDYIRQPHGSGSFGGIAPRGRWRFPAGG